MINSQKEAYKDSKSWKKFYKIIENILFIILMAILSTLIFISVQSKIIGREPSLLGHRIYIVESGSMEPTIEVNSMIFVKEIDWKGVKIGDIITYYGNDSLTRVTHRVMDIDRESGIFVTKGDANKVEDPQLLEGKNIIGKVVFKIPFIGLGLRLLGTKLSIILIIILGSGWIFLPRIWSKKSGVS